MEESQWVVFFDQNENVHNLVPVGSEARITNDEEERFTDDDELRVT